MSRQFSNVYGDDAWAEAYAGLEFPGTYHLAFRDLPGLLQRHVRRGAALDFGCGAGRSSRFLQKLGFEVVGVDISEPMLAQARARDPEGDYRHVGADLYAIEDERFELILCAFPFDNIPDPDHRLHLFRQLGSRLAPAGRIVNLVSSPDLYLHEWASFSTEAFPENRQACSRRIGRRAIPPSRSTGSARPGSRRGACTCWPPGATPESGPRRRDKRNGTDVRGLRLRRDGARPRRPRRSAGS